MLAIPAISSPLRSIGYLISLVRRMARTVCKFRASSVQTSGEIPRQLAIGNPDVLDRTRRIRAPPDKSGDAVGTPRRHRRDVAVPQRVERIVLRAAGAGVDHRDVGIAARPEVTAVQTVDIRI